MNLKIKKKKSKGYKYTKQPKRISKDIKVAYKKSMNRYYHDNLHSIHEDLFYKFPKP